MWKLHELVGQDGILRPIVNRPAAALASAQAGRLTIGRRFATCRNGPVAHKSVMKTNPLTVQITPSVSAGTGLRRNRPLADAWGYLAAPVPDEQRGFRPCPTSSAESDHG